MMVQGAADASRLAEEQAKEEREKAKEEKEKNKQKEKADKLARDKAERERKRNATPTKAAKWLTSVISQFSSISELAKETSKSVVISSGMKNEWKKTWDGHRSRLQTWQKELQAVVDNEDESEEAKTTLEKATKEVDQMLTNQKAFNLLLKSLNPGSPSTSARSMK